MKDVLWKKALEEFCGVCVPLSSGNPSCCTRGADYRTPDKNMKRYLEQGLELQGLSDMSDSTILVLARDTREIVPKKFEGKVKIQE